MKLHLALVPLLSVLGACNSYDMFRVTGFEQTTFSNRADVIFVIDNSDSMVEESRALAENFSDFVTRLEGRDATIGTDDLSDAVDRYIAFSNEPALFVDFQLAITTTDAGADAGRLLGERPIIGKYEDGVADAFIETLLCEATCFTGGSSVPNDPNYSCGEPFAGSISSQYLDCVCGQGEWQSNCGAGKEEGIEAAYQAMCRALGDPPDSCFAEPELTRAEAGTSTGLIRDRSTVVPVIVTDEGDSSRRTPNVTPLPEEYIDLVDELGVPVTWAVIGPALDSTGDVACPGLATSWGVQRYDFMVFDSGGLKVDIHDENCNSVDFGTALDSIGELIGGRVNVFPLQQVPVPESIVVQVDGKTVDQGERMGNDAFGLPRYSSGWSYDEDANAVRFHGSEIPPFGAQVRVYYDPADGGKAGEEA